MFSGLPAMSLRPLVLVASCVATAAMLTACTAADTLGAAAAQSPSAVAGPIRSGSVAYTDVTFVQTMIAHDRQTVRVADLLLAKSSVDPAVRSVAERMRQSRATEIERMVAWLAAWGLDEAPVDHDHGGCHGLLLPGQLLRFERADGPTAQAAFVEVMISRDEGVTSIAAPIRTTGSDPEVRELATSTMVTGEAEIAELEPLLGRR